MFKWNSEILMQSEICLQSKIKLLHGCFVLGKKVVYVNRFSGSVCCVFCFFNWLPQSLAHHDNIHWCHHVCLQVSNLEAKLLETGIGQKEQIGPLSSQNVGLKIHTLNVFFRWAIFRGSVSVLIYLKHIVGVIFCLEE